MATTPHRLRNWAGLVRNGSADPGTVANMLEHCAKRFEEYEARIEKLEDENLRLHASLDDVVRWDEDAE